MSDFKAMKFWIGDDPACSERVQKMLFDMGYRWRMLGSTVTETDSKEIQAWNDGIITWSNEAYVLHSMGFYEDEYINIDWLRTPKQETIELNGKNCIKADVEAALEKLKPVGE